MNARQKNDILAKTINRLRREYNNTIGSGLRSSLLYLKSLHIPSACDESFCDIEKVCLFIGYPRSGHSLVGSLIDAHPHAVISHELDTIKLVKMGFSQRQIFSLILNNSKAFSRSGRIWTGYSYKVPNQYQGEFKELRIIGDKCGNQTTVGPYKFCQHT
jgi:hypothetical protein